MADFILRPAREEDREKIISIFTASFGDGEAFVRELLNVASLLPTACCAEMEGEVHSCMFAFHGLRHGNAEASYLYALCTEPAYRGLGMGRAVVEYSARCAVEKGADAVFLRAADSGLQSWYMSAMGAVPIAPCAPVSFHPGLAAEKAEVIGCAEYMALRGGEWHLPYCLLLAQDCIQRHFGGAFLRLGGDCLCAEKTESGILIREIWAKEPHKLLSAAGEFFGVDELFILREDPEGHPLLFMRANERCTPEYTSPMFLTLD